MGAHPKPYTVRRHYNRTFGITTYTVQIQGVRDHAGLPEFYDRDEARRHSDQLNRIEGREAVIKAAQGHYPDGSPHEDY